jgi:hypothetical protein
MGFINSNLSYEDHVEERKFGPVLVITEENISKINIIPCEPVLSKEWTGTTMYRLTMDIEIFGELIPKHYVSDGASVPRLFWSLYPPVGRYMLAALIHDWKLDNQHGWGESNAVFDKAMAAIGIKASRHFAILNAVRLNGWVKSTFYGEPA